MNITALNRRVLYSACTLVLALAADAFAKGPDPTAQVLARAEAFWQLRLDGRMESAYDMLTESSKQDYTFRRFSRIQNVTVQQVNDIAVEMDAANDKHAVVRVKYDGATMGQALNGMSASQNWYFERGDWYLEYEVPNPFVGVSIPAPAANTPPADPSVTTRKKNIPRTTGAKTPESGAAPAETSAAAPPKTTATPVRRRMGPRPASESMTVTPTPTPAPPPAP
ncbi:MAG: hypothetical protein KA419_16095 [Acidobacteria bacterium]|nr:hypothetical protein [Acidobacteriota bacterium]